MMYVEFMTNFLLADSVRLILASPKTFDSNFLHIMYVAVRLILASWAKKLLDSFWFQKLSNFLHIMYVEFMKNFLPADSTGYWLLDSFSHPEPKNKWFLLCIHDVRRVDEKFF